jgi:Mlc titration factor MtfA (ptsG expression regulator)
MQQVIPLRDGLKSINFYPDEYATREEVAASIALLIDVSQDVIVNSANNATTFLDESEIREDLRANVNFAVYLGIIYGYDGNVFKPHYNITRAEIAAMICRSLEID